MTQLKFTHVGMGHIVSANRVLAVIKPHSMCARRYSKTAKEKGMYIDATMGRTLKSLLILDDGSVMGSAITPKTLLKRFLDEDLTDSIDNEDDTDEDS